MRERPSTLREMVDWVRDRAIEARRESGSVLGVWTEMGREVVLVGFAREGAACTMQFAREEYSGLRLLEMIDREIERGGRSAGEG